MKTLFVGSVALAAMIAAPAMAADLPVTYKAPPPVYYNWTGCYLGFAGGWMGGHKAYGRASDGTLGFLSGVTFNEDESSAISGIIGVTAGCNYQVSPYWVVGVEGDFSATRLENAFQNTYPAVAFFTPRTETLTSDTNWLATIRARAGFLVTPRALLYVTGGAAFAQDKSSLVLVTAANSQFQGSDTRTLAGWTVGGGGEWKMEKWFGPGWSMKAEYLYVQFEDHTFSSPMTSFLGGPPIPGASWTTTVRRNYDNIFRLGLNYTFGGPVVARY
jgi:outer membrane immunogenic protein